MSKMFKTFYTHVCSADGHTVAKLEGDKEDFEFLKYVQRRILENADSDQKPTMCVKATKTVTCDIAPCELCMAKWKDLK